MKVLVVLMKYDYGEERRGLSYEYCNVFLPFSDVAGKENCTLFDFMTIVKQKGKQAMNNELVEKVKLEKPDITLFCLFENEFDSDTILAIKKYTKTVCYFFDDPWRRKFVRYWIQYFDYFTTPDYYMYQQYISEGIENVIYSPFGFNPSIFVKKDLPKIYDVTFIGGVSPLREWTIHLLRKEGINVKAFGRGFSNFITQEEMVDIINQSRINLNLSNGISYDSRFITYSLKSPKAIKEILLLKKNREQVKGRHYEINGCGGFQLSFFVPGLNTVYEIDKEIAAFDNVYNLGEIIKFFLANEKLRENISENGYQRSLKDHTAHNYIRNIINTIMKAPEK